MDFWTRLLGGSSSRRRQAAANDPQQRLARFKKVYSEILQTWHKTATLANDAQAMVQIRMSFQRVTSILNDESRSPAPHLCLQFAASQQIYTAISKIGSTAYNEGIVRDAVAVFGALIDSEEEDFLENEQFAQALMNFIGRIVGSGNMAVGEDTEAEIVELLFGIAAKIRLQPEILPIWFSSHAADSHGRLVKQGSDFAGVTQKEDFPLCYQLIDHVHHEGRIGDFARTGLLYIFESASKSHDLERWIVGSDLPTLMATGLGALYSQLSRKLSILHPTEDLPLVLKFSDYAELENSVQADSVFSPEFQGHMVTFLSYLAFWQDVLEHCRSADVRQTLIDHFQVLFLQQLLYPSLLESSDVDGGSSVAVLTYLRRILDALDHPELVHMILHYLLALPDWAGLSSQPPRSPMAAKRRMSLMLLNSSENEDEKLNPSLFNLVDLVLSSTKSKNPQTVMAALKLVTVILGKHHGYAVGTLVKIVGVHHKEPHRTIGALNAELETYLALAMSLAGESGVDEAYESHLKDKLSLLEGHPCSLKTLALPTSPPPTPGVFDFERPLDVAPHYLIPEDPLFRSLVDILYLFLANDVETNLALTEAIINLGSCAQLRLEGWLSIDPSKYHFSEESDQDIEQFDNESLRDMERARRRPTWESAAASPLLACLQSLQAQVDSLRNDIQDFDEHLASRKQAFRVYEEINEAAKATPHIRPAQSAGELPPGSWTPQVPKYVLESSATPSRTQSPRGRKEGPTTKNTPAQSPAPSKTASVGALTAGSPSRGMSPLPAPRVNAVPQHQTTLMTDVFRNLEEVAKSPALKRRIKFRWRVPPESNHVVVDVISPKQLESNAVKQQPVNRASGSPKGEKEEGKEEEESKEVTLGHVLTNVIILQEFVLELTALVQVRASLFNEVRFV